PMAAVEIRGTSYPVLLPKLRDPRLQLAATITSLQVIGQLGFHFRLSIAQILISLGTCAVLEVAIAFRAQRVLLWPASALLTGNGVAFVLRVPGTAHGDWWSLRGWWIFAGTAAVSLLSKHVIKWRGRHIFNPSNIGLVICFLALGRNRAAPLDFWWGPTSVWLALALVVIVSGGFAILWRLQLLRVAVGFWISFAAGIGVLALAGHSMTARWHLGPISGLHFWWVLITSPEVLVFLFFMITDPKTTPRSPAARIVYAVALGVLASVLIAPTTSEFAAKVALLGALAIVCVAMPLLRLVPVALDRRALLVAAPALAGAAAAAIVLASPPPVANAFRPLPPGALPPITILPSRGVQTKLDRHTAELIAHDLLAVRPATTKDTMRIRLVQGRGQGPPTATAQLADVTYDLHQTAGGHWALPAAAKRQRVASAPTSSELSGVSLRNVAASVGLDFTQGSFSAGVSNDVRAMMGGGVCWLDYNNDGWEDLFVVNAYAGGDPVARTALFENVHGRFRNVSRATHADLPVQGDGCAAADLTGNGRTDLVVTTTTGVDILWNRGGTFVTQRLPAQGWYTGVAVADVNGDGRPDIFVAGYADPNDPVPGSLAGFPTNVAGVRDLLFLNEGGGRFREVGVQAGLEASGFRHGLGAEFVDVNGDGRPDLYVANDEDPNQLYVNVPWPGGAAADPAGLGFRFEDRGPALGVADPYAGMGIAAANGMLFVTNSRGEPTAAYRADGARFANARPLVDPALGTGFAGWGASFVDLANAGRLDLVLAAGAIPVKNLAGDAEPVKVLAPAGKGFGVANVLAPLRLNGRGLAAADAGNDGRMDVAINSIGGKLVLLRPSGPSGHWIDVALSRFTPGAVVTVGKQSRTVAAGSSYLSSEDPRVHFGLGSATTVPTLTVRYPWGAVTRMHDIRADRIVTVAVPAQPPLRTPAASSYALTACTPASSAQSIATIWDATALDVLQLGDASEPVQARDLFDLAAAMRQASVSTSPDVAVSYAAFRLLLWRASFDTNLAPAFALLTKRMRSLCYSPDFAGTAGASPAAFGNRVAAAAIAAGRGDGSNESLHYADPTYVPENQPLVVSQPGSTVHDPTFWQPLSVGRGGQSFVDAQWGHVRTFASRVTVRVRPLGTAAYRRAALAVLHASAQKRSFAVGTSPIAWNHVAVASAPGSLARDLRLYLALNGALNDAAVTTWGAKRASQAPRPISMIRYLAFAHQLPTGSRWTSPSPTPASPGGVAEASAFAYAADEVLTALLGRSYDSRARAAGEEALAGGIDTPEDIALGRTIGVRVGRLALAKASR
ncbi:MAG: VCBS repeat-containing protein, partial [Acidobacteriota bacterium]|nr:VCBS repeat-containing protein [Acidobacteriota bacterium]